MEAVSEWNGRTSREIVGALRERVRTAAHRRHDRVVEHAGRHWISWRSRQADRVFAEIRPLRGRVQVFILPGLRELSDGSGLARRAPRSQGWGWFRSRFEVTSMAQVEPAARLIIQSYEHRVRRGNGGRIGSGTRRKQALLYCPGFCAALSTSLGGGCTFGRIPKSRGVGKGRRNPKSSRTRAEHCPRPRGAASRS